MSGLAPFPSRIAFQTRPGSRLGRVALAGLLVNHVGVPEKPMRVLGNYAVVYLLRGQGSYADSAGCKRSLVAGDLLTIFPDIPHWYGPPKGSLWDEFYIVFSGPVFDLWREQKLLDPGNPVHHIEPTEYWLRRLEAVALAETESLQQVCALQQTLAEVFQVSDRHLAPQWLDQARRLLETEQSEPQDVARAFGMSYESFRRRFAQFTGTSPGRYRLGKLIDRACSLMLAGLSNKEIAERLNFCDEFHFSHRFKDVTGLTPTQFRSKMPGAPDARSS